MDEITTTEIVVATGETVVVNADTGEILEVRA